MSAVDIVIRKVLIAGSVGVGKTTAVKTVSDTPILTTEAKPTDDTLLQKQTTTVAMDFSVIWLDDALKVHLYGTPGQARFDFMWDVLAEGGEGVIVLVDSTSPNVFEEVKVYLNAFQPLVDQRRVVVGVTRLNSDDPNALMPYRKFFKEHYQNIPVLEADPRSRHDVVVLIRAALASIHLQVDT